MTLKLSFGLRFSLKRLLDLIKPLFKVLLGQKLAVLLSKFLIGVLERLLEVVFLATGIFEVSLLII